MNEKMSPELRRALEEVAKLQGRTFEQVCESIDRKKKARRSMTDFRMEFDVEKISGCNRTPTDLLMKKEIVVEWEPIRYLPVRHRMENISWMMYWMREEFKRLYQLEADRIQWEMDNELSYGIHWKIKRPDLGHSHLIIT